MVSEVGRVMGGLLLRMEPQPRWEERPVRSLTGWKARCVSVSGDLEDPEVGVEYEEVDDFPGMWPILLGGVWCWATQGSREELRASLP